MQLKKFFILLLPYLFFSLITLSSLYIFASGTYSDEIDVVGYDNGSLNFYLFYIFISILSFLFIWGLVPSRIKELSFQLKNKKMIVYLSIVLLFFYAIPIFLHGPSFLLGINRYEFNSLPYVKIFNIKLLLAVFSFIWGAYYSRDTKKFSIYLKLYFIFIFICLLYGEKASGILDSIVFFLVGYFLYSSKSFSFIKFTKIILPVLTIPILLFTIQLNLAGTADNLIESFFIRVGRQCQVFWGAYEQEILTNAIRHEIDWSGLNYYYEGLKGMKLSMYNLMPTEMYNNHTGSLAAAYPGVLFFITNDMFYLILFYIVFSIIYIVPFIFYFLFILRISYSYIILPFYVFAMTVHLKIFQSGNIFLLTNPKYILFYSFILLFILFYFVKRLSRHEI
jgi:hypothetical protein